MFYKLTGEAVPHLPPLTARPCLSLLLKEFERYFSSTKDPRTGNELMRNSFVSKPGESSISV